MRARPYCHTCGVYMKTRPLGVLPAGLRPHKLKQSDVEGRGLFDRDAEQVMAESLKTVEQLGLLAAHGQIDAIVEQMAPYEAQRKENDKLSCRLHVALSQCRVCGNGALNVTAQRGHGKQITQAPIASLPLVVTLPDDPGGTP
jgi:hypothetical protein